MRVPLTCNDLSGARINSHRHRRRGVTFVELVVAVAVVVVLIALLLPALSKAQRQARTISCLSNLRQLVGGYVAYLQANGDRSLTYDGSTDVSWMGALGTTIHDLPALRLCPEAAEPSFGWGSAKTAWGPYDARRSPVWMSYIDADSSSYGFNGWLYFVPDRLQMPQHHFRRGDADRIPVFADANWVEGRPLESDLAPLDVIRGSGPGESELGRFFIARHDQSSNIGFFDGHAEQVPLELDRFTSLKWLPPLPVPSWQIQRN